MHRSPSALVIAALFAASVVVPSRVTRGASKKAPVVVIGLEFPLTKAGSACANAGRTTFPATVTQTQTDTHGTRRVFRSTVDDRFFGTTDSVSDYYKENSYGKLELENAGVFGPYQAAAEADHYWRGAGAQCNHGAGWTDGHGEKRNEAVTKFIAEEIVKRKAFDLAKYDKSPYGNNDGTVTRDELVVVVVFPQTNTYGVARDITPTQGSSDPFTIKQGSKTIKWNIRGGTGGAVVMYTDDFSEDVDIGLVAHEFAHVFINATDMYENQHTLPKGQTSDPTAPGPFGLMDNHTRHPHLDPLHKIEKGKWLSPIVVKKDGYYKVRAVEKFADVYKLAHPSSHTGEYFLVENRQRTGYDNLLVDADGGLAIWHIDESRSDYRQRAEMEPACGVTNPIRWHQYLWAADVTSGAHKDWWDSSPLCNSQWHGGKKSQIGVFEIPASSSAMRVYFDVPGPGVLVKSSPKLEVYQEVKGSSFSVRLLNTGSSQDTFRVTFSGIDHQWLKIGQALPAGVKQTLVTDYEALFTLGSYEGARFNVSVEPPKCVGESSKMVTVSAKSTTAPSVSGSDHTQVVVKIPNQTPTADKYETNDSFDHATPIKVPATKTMVSSTPMDVTLHSATDVDYYHIEYISAKGQEGSSKFGSGGWGSFMGAFAPQYTPGGLTISAKEYYCRPLALAVYFSNRTPCKTFQTAHPVTFTCPSQTFTDKKLFVAVRMPQKKRVSYKLYVTFSGWHMTLKRPLTRPPLLRRVVPAWRKLFDPMTKYYDFGALRADLDRLVPQYNEYRVNVEQADRQHALARAMHLAGRLDEAEGLYIESLTAFGEIEARARQADVLRSMGELFSAQGRQEEAIQSFDRAAKLREILGDRAGLALDQVALGQHLLATGDATRALATFDDAIRAPGSGATNRAMRLRSLLGQADAFLALKQNEPAVACLVQAERLASEMGDAELRQRVAEQTGEAMTQVGAEDFDKLELTVRESSEAVRLRGVSRAAGR